MGISDILTCSLQHLQAFSKILSKLQDRQERKVIYSCSERWKSSLYHSDDFGGLDIRRINVPLWQMYQKGKNSLLSEIIWNAFGPLLNYNIMCHS